MIRPGVERIKSAGGLHKFMNCDLPILTDSGGFQVMSLSKLNKIDREKGAIFNSHVDGKKFYLSPEESIRVQLGLNSDIVMIMDECPKKTIDYDLIKKSMDLSLYWAERSKKAFGINRHKGLFGIVQGGLFKNLRVKSLKELMNIGFDGYALGGLAVGETQQEMFSKDIIKQGYNNGRGSFKIRGEVSIEQQKNGRERLVITSIPYQVNKSVLNERIAQLVREKKIEGIKDISQLHR